METNGVEGAPSTGATATANVQVAVDQQHLPPAASGPAPMTPVATSFPMSEALRTSTPVTAAHNTAGEVEESPMEPGDFRSLSNFFFNIESKKVWPS